MNIKRIILMAALLGTATVFAGPSPPYGGPHKVAPRAIVTVNPTCEFMTIPVGGRNPGTMVVRCDHYAKVRPADCRVACAAKAK